MPKRDSSAARPRALPPLNPKSPGRPSDNRYREQYGVIVICPNEKAQAAIYRGLTALAAGTKLRVVVT